MSSAHDERPASSQALHFLDPSFLASDDARAVRILAEYVGPLAVFSREEVHDTIVFFGSARVKPGSHWYDAAREVARRITTWTREHPGHEHRFLVCSGGGPGIMEAANRGARDAGGRSIGLNITLPHEQHPNPFITPPLNLEFRYFFMRKLWFAHLAAAAIVFPGGLGTLDELFELLTLAQTHKLDRSIPVVLYDESFWRRLIDFDGLVEQGMIARDDLELFSFANSPEQAFELLTEALGPLQVTPRTPCFAHSSARDASLSRRNDTMENDDRQAFMEAVRPHLDELLENARHHLAYHEAAGDLPERKLTPEELVGETLIVAFSGRERRPDDVPLRDWLLGLQTRTLDRLLDKEAQDRKLWAVSLEQPLPTLDPLEVDDNFWDWYQPDAVERYEDVLPSQPQRQQSSALVELLEAARQLPRPQWRAWLLSEVHQLSPKNVAASLREGVDKVAQLAKDAAERLRERN